MFDGVHVGHQEILKNVISKAKESSLKSAVLTFWPHPRLVFDPNANLQLLTTIEEKTKLLEKLGIDHLIIQEFDEEFRDLTGRQFVEEVVLNSLDTQLLIIGHDHVFGKNKSGNFHLLEEMSETHHFQVKQIGAINIENQDISSTKIRLALQNGNIVSANKMLGYPYRISGIVVDGKKLGRKIGYPTANLQVEDLKLLPKKGAYIVEVLLKDQYYKGMLSIGTNPTVGGENLTVEVYIINFDREIYGETVSIKFRDFLHDEIKFESVEKLVERLDHDKELTERFEF